MVLLSYKYRCIMGKFDDIKRLKELLDNGLISNEDFQRQKKFILDSTASGDNVTPKPEPEPDPQVKETAKQVEKNDAESKNNRIGFMVVIGLIIVFFISVGISVRHDRIILDKKDYASELTKHSKFHVSYKPKKNVFRLVMKDGTEWQEVLESNSEQYDYDDSVKTYFIRSWRNTVIPQTEEKSNDYRGKGSTFKIIDSRDGSTELLKVKNGKVLYDRFSDIED